MGALVNSAFLASGWSIGNLLKNLNNSLRSWGGMIVVIIGVVMVIVAIFNIAKGLMGGGRGQVNWVLNIALFFIGGALAFGAGWGLVQQVSEGGSSTLQDLGNGTTVTTVLPVDVALSNLGVTID